MALTKVTQTVIGSGAIGASQIASGAITSTHLTNITTDNVSEGSNNIYFSNSRARSSLSGSTGVTYNSSTGAISIGQSVGTTDGVTFASLNVDNYTLDNNRISTNQSGGYNGDILLDAAGDITLDADGGDVRLKDNGVEYLNFYAGTIERTGSLIFDVSGNITLNADGSTISLNDGTVNFGQLYQNASGALNIYAPTQDKDIVFLGNDGGSTITALTLDMSAGGNAIFSDLIKTGNMSISGQEIDVSSGDLTLDVAGDIILDADGGDIKFQDAGTDIGSLIRSGNDLQIKSAISNGNMVFRGNDGGTIITALTLDMSSEGDAIFNNDILMGDDNPIRMGDNQDLRMWFDGSHGLIQNTTADSDILIKGKDGSTTITMLWFDTSATGRATFSGDINTPGSIAATSDASQIQLGSGNRGQIFHNSAGLYMRTSTGPVYAQAGSFAHISTNSSTTYLTSDSSGLTLAGYLRGPSTFTIDPAAHGDDTGTVVIAGNLQVDGTTTTINSTTVTVDDKNIVLASGSTNKAAADGAGITVDCGSDTDATILYDGTDNEWDFNKDIKVTGSVTADSLTVDTSAGQLDVEALGGSSVKVKSSGSLKLQGTGGSVDLINGTTEVLSTTSSGINVTGNIKINSGSGQRFIEIDAGTSGANTWRIYNGMSWNPDSLLIYDHTGDSTALTIEPGKLGVNRGANSLSHNFEIDGTSYFNGNVGIGVAASSHKLDVNGTIRAQGAITSTLTSSGGTFLSIGHSGNENWSFDAKSGSGSTDYVDFGIAGSTRCMTWQEDGNVGIGTSSPSSLLTIKNNGSGGTWPFRIFNSQDSDMLAGFYESSSGDGYNGMLYMNDGAGNTDVKLSTNGASWFNGGNVGIGTSNPNTPLEIHGSDIATGVTTTASSVLRLVRDVVDPNYTNRKDSAVDFMLSRQQAVGNNYPYTRLDIRLAGGTDTSTPSLDVMSLLHNGNVGIGTASPETLLHVQKSSSALYSSSMSGTSSYIPSDSDMIQIRNSNAGVDDIYAGIWFETGTGATNTTGSDRAGRIALVVDNDNSYSSNFVFQTRGNNAVLTEKMRIQSDGKVGIGTNDPDYLLHAENSTATGPSYIATSGNGQFVMAMGSQNSPNVAQEAFIGTLSDTRFKIKVNNTVKASWTDGGLAIGTQSSAAAPLHIQFSDNTGAVGGLLIKNTNTGTTANFASISTQAENGTIQGTFGSSYYSTWGNRSVFAGSQTAHPFKILTSNAVRATFDTSGKVGIGFTTPSNKLAVDGVITSGNFTAAGVSGTPGDANTAEVGPGYLILARDDTADAAQVKFGKNGAVHSYLETRTNGLGFITNVGDFAFEGGNVGIGTTSPAAKLHISGNSDVSDEDCMLIIDDIDGSAGSRIPAIMFRSNTSGTITNQGRIRATDTQGMVLSGTSALGDDLVIGAAAAGRVSVGTTTQSADGLTIGTSNNNCELDMTHTSGKRYRLNSAASGKFSIENKTDGYTNLFVINAQKIGIGLNNPSAFLHVTGSEGSQYSGSFNNTSSQGWGLFVKGGADGDDYSLRVQNKNADELLTVRSNSKVGIGTNNPGQQLSVVGAVESLSGQGSVAFYSTVAGSYNQQNGTSGTAWAYGSTGGSSAPNTAASTTFGFHHWNGSAWSNPLNLTTAGKVGIGEASPLGTLHVRTTDSGATADTSADDLIVENNSNTGISILSGTSSTGSIYFGDSGTNWDGYIAYTHGSGAAHRKFVIGTAAGGNSLSIDAIGHVGIAKQTPIAWSSGYKSLQVGGRGFVGAHSSSDLYVGQNAYFNSGWKYEDSVTASLTQHSGGEITHFVAAAGTAGNAITWTRALHIKNNGNVGFGGSSNPSFPVEINSTTGADALQLVGRNGDNISSFAFSNNAKSVSSYIQSDSSWMRVRADGGFHFKRGGTPSTANSNAFTITDANLIVTADSYLNGDLKVGTDSSDPGAIYITDDSTTAYTLGIIGTGTRQFEFRGSSSGADYYTSFTNPSTGGHNLTVNGNFTAVSTNGSAILINGNNGGLSFTGGNNRIYFNSARALEGNGTTLQLGEGHATGLYQMANNSFYGNITPSSDDTYDLGSGSHRWRNVYTGDLHLSNENKEEGNEVDGTTGNWTIQEGEEHLFIINNKSGKKYRFALEEIE